MTPELRCLVASSRHRRMTAQESEEHFREFAAANAGIDNPRITRAVLDAALRNAP